MVDFGKTAQDYGKHRLGFPDSCYDCCRELGAEFDGRSVLDIGTGTGTLARGFAARGATPVVGMDPSIELLEAARGLANADDLQVEFKLGSAESTAEPDTHFDIVSAGQCWHWFDRPAAAGELKRILKPGGRIVIAHYDWIPLPGNVVAATESLIESHNPEWRFGGGNGVYGRWVTDLGRAGFTQLAYRGYDEPAIYSHEAWRGRIRASAGIAATLAPPGVAAFDAELAELLHRQFPEEPLEVHHRVFVLVGVRP